MKILGYDTETTGFPLWGEPSDDPRQPHLVELGFVLHCDELGRDLIARSTLVHPSDWMIPQEVSEIHGITDALAQHFGHAERDVLDDFLEAWREADMVVGHNEPFDARIMRIAMKRYHPDDEQLHDRWKNRERACTQQLATPLVKAPPSAKMRAAGRHHHKTANLSEAYKHVTGRELEGAHSALADARASIEVYLALRGSGPSPKPAPSKPTTPPPTDDMPGFLQ